MPWMSEHLSKCVSVYTVTICLNQMFCRQTNLISKPNRLYCSVSGHVLFSLENSNEKQNLNSKRKSKISILDLSIIN